MPGMIASSFIGEIQHESATTRKLLERLPVEKRDFSPHAKSWPLHKLATHVAQLGGWTAVTCETDELDISKPFPAPTWATAAELVKIHDDNTAHAIKALGNTADADFTKPWTFRNGATVMFTLPKVHVIRSMCLNHGIHHRGQLSIYLRLLDVPLPNMYGPTADER